MPAERGAASKELARQLGTALQEVRARHRVPGAQVVIRRAGELLWSACVGRLGQGPSAPDDAVRPDDRFVVASVTKLVIACTALSLVESGELALDEPVSAWLPDLPHGDRLTLRLLLGHRSGLREYFQDAEVRRKLGDPTAAWTREELLEAVARLSPEAAPDTRLAYRNTNYLAVGEILTRCTGRTVDELVQEQISRPLGLPTFSFTGNGRGTGRLAAPHKRRLLRAVDLLPRTDGVLPTHTLGAVWTDGGLASSAEDLATFTEAAFTGRLLSPETVDDMTHRSASPGSPVGGVLGRLQTIYLGRADRSYGLGVEVERRAGHTTYGHEGMYYGWSATTSFDPSTRVTISVVTNLAAIPVPAERIARALRGAMHAGR